MENRVGGVGVHSSSIPGGGAVFLDGTDTNASFVAKNCTFQSNTADKQGAAIYMKAGSTTTLTKCTLSSNSASTQGGSIYVNAANLTTNGCFFTENTATSHGGAIESTGAATIRLNQCVFTDNQSISDASADLYIGGSTSIFANGCYFGQSATDKTPASKTPHRILTGSSTQAVMGRRTEL